MSIRSARRRPRGELESEILGVLWAADGALVPGQVQQALGHDLAYNTVHTILTRLYAKGAVTRQAVGRAHAYRPVLDGAGLAARQMTALLDKGGDRAAVLRRFVAALGTGDEQMLLAVLREHQGQPPSATEG